MSDDGAGPVFRGKRLSAGYVPPVAPPGHALQVDKEREQRYVASVVSFIWCGRSCLLRGDCGYLCRIMQRSRDPKRRQALMQLLKSSKSQPAIGSSDSTPRTVAPPPPNPVAPVYVPQLSVAPVLQARAQQDDASKLNRAVMWEELAKAQAQQCVASCVDIQILIVV